MNLEAFTPYALPLAMGLAGAALYHLGAAFFRYIFDVEAYNPKNVMHLDGWAREDLMKADAKANVRLDALEERMAALENIEHLDGNLAGAIITLAERGGSLKIETPKVPYGSPVAHGFAGLPNTTIW